MAKKYMIFSLGAQRYAISLHVVREVIGLPKITPVPGLPPEFKGLINLRGRIIPTLDLIARLQPDNDGQRSKRPTIVIADLGGQQVGLMVDEVVEVIPVGEDQIDANVEGFQAAGQRAVIGVAKCEDRDLTLILGLDRLISFGEIQMNVNTAANTAA